MKEPLLVNLHDPEVQRVMVRGMMPVLAMYLALAFLIGLVTGLIAGRLL